MGSDDHATSGRKLVSLVIGLTPMAVGWAFAVAGQTVWNSLPDFIRNPSISTDSFRRLLKTYLFAQY